MSLRGEKCEWKDGRSDFSNFLSFHFFFSSDFCMCTSRIEVKKEGKKEEKERKRKREKKEEKERKKKKERKRKRKRRREGTQFSRICAWAFPISENCFFFKNTNRDLEIKKSSFFFRFSPLIRNHR